MKPQRFIKTSEICGDFCKKNTAQVFAKLLLTLSSMCHRWLHRLAGFEMSFYLPNAKISIEKDSPNGDFLGARGGDHLGGSR